VKITARESGPFWKNVRRNSPIPEDFMNLYQILAKGFPADRSLTAIEIPGSRNISWQELEDATARISNWLISLRLEPGSRVAAQVPKSPESLFLYLATLRAGMVYLPLNTAYQEAEIDYFLENASPSVVVADPLHHSWMATLAKKRGVAHLLTLDGNGQGSLIDTVSQQSSEFETVDVSRDTLASIIYTSGTTGRSKGAMLTHGNLSSNASVLHKFWGWRSDDVLVHILPLFHVHGLFVAVNGALLAGAKMIWVEKFSPPEVVSYLERATVLMGVPTHYVRLLGEATLTRESCRNMRLFISGSAPLLTETFQQFHNRTGHTILERYGMSETAMLVSNPYDSALGPRIAGTVGMPLPDVSVRIVKEDGAECGPGETGNIQVKGPNVFSGYWQMPEKTREEFTEDGWFRTGDLGRWGGTTRSGEVIPGNYVSIVGRSKDLIISGGYNVYPKEIEGFLDDLPGVEESAVVGVPHPDFGEAVIAAVVPKRGSSPDPEEWISLMKERIANYKVPKKIHLMEELPRNAMGKVQKNLLRDQFSTPNNPG